MPIYEYRCPSCENQFESLQRVTAPAPACPACGQEETTKMVSRTTFHLKGTGWYATDYKSSSSASSTSSSSESSASSDDGGGDGGGGCGGGCACHPAAEA